MKREDEWGLEHSLYFSLKLTVAFSQTKFYPQGPAQYTFATRGFLQTGHCHSNNDLEVKVPYPFKYTICQSVILEPYAPDRPG